MAEQTLGDRVLILEIEQKALQEAMAEGFRIRDERWGQSLDRLADDVRWIRNVFIGTVLLGIFMTCLGIVLGKI